MKKFNMLGKIFFVSTAVVLLAAGCNTTTKTTQTPTPVVADQTNSTASQAISYQGQDGKTALEILKATHTVQTENYSGIGEYVKTIDGVTPDKDHFWGFYVNGASSNVGASQYQTKSTDNIEWKLDTITSDSN